VASKSLSFLLLGQDVSASSAIKGVETQAHSSTQKIGGAFSKLGGQIGGEFGEMLNRVGEGFDKAGEHGMKMGAKIVATGGVVAGVGAALTLGSSKEKAAQDQLAAAIDATGNAAGDYKKEIEEAVKGGEKFAHNAADTKGALAALTLATQDPKKALADMTIVENLAAAKHESLTEAAGQLARVYGGAGKVLKQYGITLDSTAKQSAAVATAEKQHQAAVTTLSAAQKHLSELEEIDAAKSKLSVSQQISLRNAHQAVTDAINKHGAGSAQAQAAEQKLTDEEARLTAGSNLTAAQQIALRDAHDKVTKAAADLKLKTENLKIAQDKNKTSTQNADKALDALGKRLDGQASASVDNWGGKLAVLRTKLSDWTAEFGQKFGPAITAAGVVISASGVLLDIYRGHQAKMGAAALIAAGEIDTEAAAVRGLNKATKEGGGGLPGGPVSIGPGKTGGKLPLGIGGGIVAAITLPLITSADQSQIQKWQTAMDSLAKTYPNVKKLGVEAFGGLAQAMQKGTITVDEYKDALKAGDVKVAEAEANFRHLGEAQEKQRKKAKDAKDAQSLLNLVLGKTPSKVVTNVGVPGATQSWADTQKLHKALSNLPLVTVAKIVADTGDSPAKIAGIQHLLAGIKPKNIPISANVDWSSFASAQNAIAALNIAASNAKNKRAASDHTAGGASFFAGGRTAINESGQETIDLPRGTRIYPHGQTPPSQGGTTVINVYPRAMLGTKEDAVRWLTDAMNQLRKRRGLEPLTF
jgi:hypothetical protein